MASRLLIHAPAKLNLALSVGGRRPDGMHPICSWMLNVDFFDELELVALPGGTMPRFATNWHEDAPRKDDLEWPLATDVVVRAHGLMEQTVAMALPVQARLEKRIPVGGGLGGGSADAAAMLVGLNRLFDLGIGTGKLAEMARQLGSDVPFFVHGGSALVEGIGDAITVQEDVPPFHAVLAFPQLACPTSEVFARFDELHARDTPVFQEERVREQATTGAPACFNDLAEAAFDLFPALRDLAGDLAAIAEAPANLTGSGSTFFMPAGDPLHAEHLAAAIIDRLDVPARAVSSTRGVAITESSAENA